MSPNITYVRATPEVVTAEDLYPPAICVSCDYRIESKGKKNKTDV